MTTIANFLENKLTAVFTWLVSGGLIAQGVTGKAPETDYDFSIHNWQDIAVVMGVVWIVVQMTPRLYALYKWIKSRKKGKKKC